MCLIKDFLGNIVSTKKHIVILASIDTVPASFLLLSTHLFVHVHQVKNWLLYFSFVFPVVFTLGSDPERVLLPLLLRLVCKQVIAVKRRDLVSLQLQLMMEFLRKGTFTVVQSGKVCLLIWLGKLV